MEIDHIRKIVVDALRETAPSEAEVFDRLRATRRRREARRAPRTLWKPVALLGLASGAVAALAIWFTLRPQPPAKMARDGALVPLALPRSVSGESIPREDDHGQTSEVPPARESASVEAPRVLLKSPVETARLGSLKATQESALWEKIRTALERGDDATALQLVGELSLSQNPETRDNARLTRVRLAQARAKAQGVSLTSEEVAELEDLERHAKTSSVRASARRLLATAHSNSEVKDPPEVLKSGPFGNEEERRRSPSEGKNE